MSYEPGEYWQSNKKSIQERNAHMFNNSDMSDIQLACGETKTVVFYAHKYVLATSSPVFHKMFFGSLPEPGPVIHLPDTDKESLEAFLRYLYTDATPSTAELALKVMYLAHKYMITALVNECVNIIKPKVSPEKAFFVIRYAMLVAEECLVEIAWQVVDSQTRDVIKSEHFCDIDVSLLSEFLKRDSLRITEIELFRAVLKWTESQCETRDLEVTEENRRIVLGDAIYHLRFLAMSQHEFLQEVVPTRLLDSQDILSILQKFLGYKPESLKWTVTKKRYDYLRLARFDAKDVRAHRSTWRYLLALVWYKFYANPDPYFSWDYSRGSVDCIRFRIVNSERKPVRSKNEKYEQENVMFWGVRLFGDAYGSTYHVTMTIEFDDIKSEVSGSYMSELVAGNGYGFDVVLQKPFKIELRKNSWQWNYQKPYTLESNWHTVKLTIKGPRSYFGVRGKNTVSISKHRQVEFQDSCHYPNNNTDSNTGQIWQVLLTPC